jgi:hypothetical protein
MKGGGPIALRAHGSGEENHGRRRFGGVGVADRPDKGDERTPGREWGVAPNAEKVPDLFRPRIAQIDDVRFGTFSAFGATPHSLPEARFP